MSSKEVQGKGVLTQIVPLADLPSAMDPIHVRDAEQITPSVFLATAKSPMTRSTQKGELVYSHN